MGLQVGIAMATRGELIHHAGAGPVGSKRCANGIGLAGHRRAQGNAGAIDGGIEQITQRAGAGQADHRPALQLGQLHRLAGGKLPCLCQHHQLGLDQGLDTQPGLAGRGVDQGQFAITFEQPAQHFVVVHGLHVHAQLWMLPAQCGDCRRQHMLAQRRHAGHPQQATGQLAQVAHGLVQRGQTLVDLTNLAVQRMGLLGRYQPPSHQLEQGHAELGLGVVQHLAHRRLGHVQLACRRADRTGGVDGMEDFDLAQAHGR